MIELLDRLELPTVSIVGVDTGGALAQLLMADHRDRVDLVVLTACDAYEHFPPRNRLGWLFRPVFWRPVLPAVAQAMRLRVARRVIVPRPLSHRGVDDERVHRWTVPLRDPAIRRDVRKAFSSMHPRYTLRAAAANRDLPRQVVIAWSDDDRLFEHQLAQRLAGDLPDARLITLPDCGAFAAIDQPGPLATIIDDLLRPPAVRPVTGPG